MKTISIWSDFACPYCYIGEKRLKDAIRELGVEDQIKLDYRAFELNPNAPLHSDGTIAEKLAAKYGLTPEQAKSKIEEIDRLGKDVGLDMKYGKARPTNTFDAHRLLKFAEFQYEPGVVEALNEAIFKAYFTDHELISDRKLLMKLAENAGMDATQCHDLLDSDLYANQVRYDEREAASRGVHGVPYMLFDGEFAVPGAISTEDCKAVIREMLGRNRDAHEGLKTTSCDENGCAVK